MHLFIGREKPTILSGRRVQRSDLGVGAARLTDLEVRIPRLQVVTLERLAAIDGRTISAVLARELEDLVSVHAPWLVEDVPGFAAAFAWPFTDMDGAG